MSRPSLPVNEAIELRRSTKDFNDTPIDPEVLDEILRLTVAAPSSWNLQPWRIVVIDQAEDREKLHSACFNQRQVLEAPVTLVFAVDHQAWKADMEQVIEQARERDRGGVLAERAGGGAASLRPLQKQCLSLFWQCFPNPTAALSSSGATRSFEPGVQTLDL